MAQVSDTKDNLFDRLGRSQTFSRQILREAVPWSVARLGPRFPCASLRGLLYPIVQEVVVARKIGGIENHEEYNMLRKPRPDAEFALLQKLQESMHKNGKNLRDNIRDIVIPFFKDDTEDEKVNHVKYETFDVGGCASIMEEEHHVYQAFNAMEHPTVNGQPARPRPRARARARAHDHARTRRPSRQGARPGSACRQQREDGRQTA